MSNCRACKNWNKGQLNQEGGPTCKAFPEGIPLPVWYEQVDHFEPIEGDNGIQFHSDMDEGEGKEFTRKVIALARKSKKSP